MDPPLVSVGLCCSEQSLRLMFCCGGSGIRQTSPCSELSHMAQRVFRVGPDWVVYLVACHLCQLHSELILDGLGWSACLLCLSVCSKKPTQWYCIWEINTTVWGTINKFCRNSIHSLCTWSFIQTERDNTTITSLLLLPALFFRSVLQMTLGLLGCQKNLWVLLEWVFKRPDAVVITFCYPATSDKVLKI